MVGWDIQIGGATKMDGQIIKYMYKSKIEARSRNHCYNGKAIVLYIMSIPVALVIQHAMRMRRIILSSVVSLACISTLSHKEQDC